MVVLFRLRRRRGSVGHDAGKGDRKLGMEKDEDGQRAQALSKGSSCRNRDEKAGAWGCREEASFRPCHAGHKQLTLLSAASHHDQHSRLQQGCSLLTTLHLISRTRTPRIIPQRAALGMSPILGALHATIAVSIYSKPSRNESNSILLHS